MSLARKVALSATSPWHTTTTIVLHTRRLNTSSFFYKYPVLWSPEPNGRGVSGFYCWRSPQICQLLHFIRIFVIIFNILIFCRPWLKYDRYRYKLRFLSFWEDKDKVGTGSKLAKSWIRIGIRISFVLIHKTEKNKGGILTNTLNLFILSWFVSKKL